MFIAPISLGIKKYGLSATLSGLAATGVVYLVFTLIVFRGGSRIIDRILPSVVTAPVIMVIGLSLANTAVEMATEGTETYSESTAIVVAGVSLLAKMLTAILTRGFWRLIPILVGILAGYIVALPLGLVDFSPIADANWLALPSFTAPSFNLPAILFILPVAIAPAIEHIGDVLAISSVTGKDYLRDPGIHRTLLGDGIAKGLSNYYKQK